jgi:hypothetical protein
VDFKGYVEFLQKVQFSALPTSVKFSVWLSFVFLWIAFERLVIEPFNIYRFMPFYRVEGFCPWDALAIIVITVVLLRMNAAIPAD